jgi:hypothetical protein
MLKCIEVMYLFCCFLAVLEADHDAILYMSTFLFTASLVVSGHWTFIFLLKHLNTMFYHKKCWKQTVLMAHFNGAKNLHILFLAFTFGRWKINQNLFKVKNGTVQKPSNLLPLLVFCSLFTFLSQAVVLQKASDNTKHVWDFNQGIIK